MRPPAIDLTVVIPVFNYAAYLAEAVDSVRRQTRPPRRIIIVDDGSTDATPQVADELCKDRHGAAVEYVRQDNRGPAAAINRGVALAESELIAFQSADDVWLPHKIEWQMQALDDGADLVFGHVQNFISPELGPDAAAALQCPSDPMPGHSAETLLTRLETFRRIGPLNEAFPIGEFFEWYGRASDLGLKIATLPQTIAQRRLHGRNHSLTRARQTIGYAHVLKSILDRRRAETKQS